MELTAIFSEWSVELGLNVTIGEKYLGNIDQAQAHEKANRIIKVLKEIKKEEVSYFLQTKDKNVLVGI